jgi:hypothetical protein
MPVSTGMTFKAKKYIQKCGDVGIHRKVIRLDPKLVGEA